MKKALVVTYFYPPYDTTAALEASKLTRYLGDHGWSPIILAATNDYLPTLPLEVDEAIVHRTKQIDVNRLPKQVLQRNKEVYEAHVTESATAKARAASALGRAYRQVVNFPDAHIGWFPYAVAEGRRLIRKHDPDLIFSIGGPFTDHLVASRLVRDHHLPWFADFRDLWTDNHFFRRIEPLLSVERRIEQRTLAAADGLSTVSPQWVEILRKRFRKPTWLIPNGFEPREPRSVSPPRDRFTLTYTGVYYSRGQEIAPLLRGLSDLRLEGLITPADFQLRLVGRFLRSLDDDVRRCGLDGLVTIQETVPHAESLEMQSASTALLFLLWARPEGRGWLSAKVYDYMAAGRPILSVGPTDTDAARFVRSIGAGEVASDRTGVAAVLRRWIAQFRATGRVEVRPDPTELQRYEWRAIGERLAAAFDETLQRNDRRA